ncbi:hypothetical protein GCM10008983_28150 [Lentibacillus halophilus]|uniref:PLD phosphodiesterase domain-containing protein n=1 Tax=Lentibacillus halophilus TaxID=295065 RepID=A0ABN0ZI16_9BACI
MDLLTKEFESHLFKEIENCNKSIVIISPFLSTNTIEKLIEIVLRKNLSCTVITRFERKAFIDGASSLKALKILIQNNITLLALKDLHSKVYIFDNKNCMVGSANFTHKALNKNHELLLKPTDPEDISLILEYKDQLIKEILDQGDFSITDDQVEIEMKITEDYLENDKSKKVTSYNWGAELNNLQFKEIDREKVVLSVSAGGTHKLVSKYLIHAHPNDRNYKQLENLITFRQAKGGQMDAIYQIDSDFILDPFDWKSELDRMGFPTNVKERVKNYIIERSKGFGFEKPIAFKFYVLSLVKELNHEPLPKINNAGPRYYTVGDLLSGDDDL